MEQDKLEGLLIDYIDGKLSESESREVEHELAQNPAAVKLHDQLKEVLLAMTKAGDLVPSQRLRQNFDQALKEEMKKSSGGRQIFLQPVFFRAAAAILLVGSGIAIGFWINKNQEREAELLALKKDLQETKQLMISMMDNTQSASQRMQGVTVALKIEKADDEIVRALTKAMNEDPNTNVRLAALEALGKFRQQDHVRRTLITSLATQKDAMVQIALIRLLVDMKEKEAVKEMQRITNDIEALPAVKDEAHAGILKLS